MKMVVVVLAIILCLILLSILIPKKLSIFTYNTSSLDPERHWNQNNYKSLLAPDNLCTNATTLLILIISSPEGFERRQAFRETILTALDRLPHVKYAFLIGQQSSHLIEEKIIAEHVAHNDIIQGSFHDSYENLTLKSLFAIHWAANHCARLHFLFKLDNDVYANIELIDKFLENLTASKNTIIGVIYKKHKPIRKKLDKWHADTFYTHEYYPTYASGPAYVISADILETLFYTAMQIPMLRIEDVFITGVCASHIPGLNHVDNSFITSGFSANSLKLDTVKTAHSYSVEEIRLLWNKAHPEGSS